MTWSRRRDDGPEGGSQQTTVSSRPIPICSSTSSKRSKDGIVVRGAKAHQTGAVNSHEIVVMPTLAHARGRQGLCRFVCPPVRYAGDHSTSSGANPVTPANSKAGRSTWATRIFGGHEALVVFEDVFVPWERVFMCGEFEFAGPAGRTVRRVSPPELCLQGRRRRRADRRRSSDCRLQRRGAGVPRQRQDHRDEPSQ